MLTEPRALIVETLDNLQTLSTYLRDETDERLSESTALTQKNRKYKEALLTISVLLPKLEAVRGFVGAAQQGRCATCDD